MFHLQLYLELLLVDQSVLLPVHEDPRLGIGLPVGQVGVSVGCRGH